MFMMTAKVDKKRIALFLAAGAAAIALLLFLTGGRDKTPAPEGQPVSMSTNEARVQYLETLGWQVDSAPVQTQEVKIPTESNDVMERYNQLQKSQGFDLSAFAGKTATRYVYQIRNYPDAAEPVYATLLVYKGEIIGGDVTNTAANGTVQGLAS